jgi:SAM-dependent methyltransferase
MVENIESISAIREYYGKVLQGKRDLKTNACCCAESIPESHREILAEIDGEVLEKFYGCGSPIPPALALCAVLDLGCGAGRDVFLVSRLIKTPAQYTAYAASQPFAEDQAKATSDAVRSITSFYESAMKRGHIPSESWFVANESF